MNLSICLDQYASNYNVNNLSSNGFNIYTDLDLVNPIAQGIPYTSLFSPPLGNCPYLLTNIPSGATQIYVADNCVSNPQNPSSTVPTFQELVIDCCYAIIPIPQTPTTSSWCDTVNLNFDVFSSSFIGQIVAGNLTSTLGTVTDYKIGWYKDGNYSSPIFTSGKGTTFTPYQFTHPLTGSSAVPSLAGNWEGIIHDIAINGVTYSSVSGSAGGQPIPFESCFDTIVVSPLTCNNGPYSATSKYSHQINFNSQAAGATSSPTSLTYTLSPTTKYFAYAFKGFSVWDELEIKWKSGNPAATSNPSLYSQPIYLEKLKTGGNASGPQNANLIYSSANPIYNFTLSSLNNVWPKFTTETGYVQRLLTLTGLETSSNPSFPDLLEITVTPNPSNNNTQWIAGFQCLNTFNCIDCATTNYSSSLPNIYKIRLEKQYGCDAQRIQLFVTGCYAPSDFIGNNPNQTNLPNPLMTSTWANIGYADLSYIGLSSSPSGIKLDGSFLPSSSPTNVFYSPIPAGTYVNLKGQTSCTTAQPGTTFCAPGSTGTITLNKTLQQIQLTFTLESDYLHYKNNLDGLMTTYGVTTPVACDSTGNSVSYFKYIRLTVPIQNSAAANCGDNTQAKTYYFHVNDYFNITYIATPSANDPTVGFWSITIPQTPMVNCYPQNLGCDSCYSSINTFVSIYNNIGSVTSPNTFTFTTNVGAKYDNPFRISYINKNTSTGLSGSYCPSTTQLIERDYSWYSTNTVPFISSSASPTGWVNLPSLGASFICGTGSFSETGLGPLGGRYEQYLGGWQVRFPNLTSSFNYSTSTNNFEIYAFTGFGNTGSFHASQAYPLPCPDPLGAKIYSYIGGVATVYTASHFLNNTTPTLVIDP
jgi:hypothetical protein